MNLPTVLFEWLILLLFSCSANWSLFLLAILSCRLCIFSVEYPPSWVSLPSFSCWGQNEALQAEFVFTDQQTVKGSDFLFHFRSSFQSHPGCVCFSISKPQEEKKKKKSSITQLFVKVKLLPLCASSKLSECWSDSQMVINHPCTGCIAVVIFRESVSVLPLPFNS